MHKTRHQADAQRTYRDPVCGMEVSRSTAVVDCAYRGKSYYFCAPSCREAFEARPEYYLGQHLRRA